MATPTSADRNVQSEVTTIRARVGEIKAHCNLVLNGKDYLYAQGGEQIRKALVDLYNDLTAFETKMKRAVKYY